MISPDPMVGRGIKLIQHLKKKSTTSGRMYELGYEENILPGRRETHTNNLLDYGLIVRTNFENSRSDYLLNQ